MNYTSSQPIIQDYPYDNIFTKVACGVGVAWLAFIGIKHAKYADQLPQRRKGRQGLTSNNADLQIDSRNRAMGTKVLSNPDVPFHSRHNYNRRRRSKNFW